MGRSYQFGALVTGICLAAALWVLPIWPATRGRQTRSLSNAKQLATGCKLYAIDHQGRFPVHLGELVPDYIPTLDGLRYLSGRQSEKSNVQFDWLYFGAGFGDSDSLPVLIASPQATTIEKNMQRRIVVDSSTSGQIIRESAYQELLANMVKQMRTMDDARHPATPAPPAPPAPRPPSN